jgi:predicted transcriptional regulator
MSNPILQLNKAFDNRIRLGIMALLMVNDKVSFNMLKESLELTDGNLASHLSSLEQLGYIQVQKQFIGRKPNTTYCTTSAGKVAFKNHLDGLEQMIKLGSK